MVLRSLRARLLAAHAEEQRAGQRLLAELAAARMPVLLGPRSLLALAIACAQ